MSPNTLIHTILFDLDGTLLDTAPDLCFALNQTLHEIGLPALSLAITRPLISTGAAGMIAYALANQPGIYDQKQLAQRLVTIYQQHIAVHTRLFKGMAEVLNNLEKQDYPWGIVTNKHARLTEPLLHALNLHERPACIISGDTTAHSKPHPEPLLEACRQIDCDPSTCVYIGDAEKDIQAGLAAGMTTWAATYGYIADDDHPERWGASGLIHTPKDILNWV